MLQAYEVEAYLGYFAWEYDVTGIVAEATEDMTDAEFLELCEAYNLHKKAIKSINKAFETACYFLDDDKSKDADIWFDKYESRIEYWSKKLGISYNKLEDDCTEVRELGFDRC